jgi:hypothetical protein
MNAPPATNPTKTRAPLALWRIAAAFMRTLHMLFGAPEDVARGSMLTLKAHQLLATWLRRGEAMMRRLLLIEAAAFAKPNIRPLLRASRKRARKAMSFTPDTPEKWRVSFRCFSDRKLPAGKLPLHPEPQRSGPRRIILRNEQPAPRPHAYHRRRRNRTRRKPILRQERECVVHEERATFRSAWPLAERYEALLRAFNNPLPYARRIARALHATPHRARELLLAPPAIARQVDPAITNAAETSAALFNTS